MCSTFKLIAVSDVLARGDRNEETLTRRIAYSQKDLLDWAPVTRAHVEDGAMSIEGLCAAAIQYSDNTASNLLLEILGGPNGATAFARSMGDAKTHRDTGSEAGGSSKIGVGYNPVGGLAHAADHLDGELQNPLPKHPRRPAQRLAERQQNGYWRIRHDQ